MLHQSPKNPESPTRNGDMSWPMYSHNLPEPTGETWLGEPGQVALTRSLQPGESVTVNTTLSLYEPQDVEQSLGFRASVPMVVHAGGKELLAVDLSSFPTGHSGWKRLRTPHGYHDFAADMLLVSLPEWQQSGGDRGFKALRAGEQLTFGRDNPSVLKRFDGLDELSRRHFSLDYSQAGLQLSDLQSSNGTQATYLPYRVRGDRTVLAGQRLQNEGRFRRADEQSPHGYMDGLPIIGRESRRVSGGVYLGGSAREAITVLPDQDPRIEAAYQRFAARQMLGQAVRRVLRPSVESDVRGNLRAVKTAVRATMTYASDEVDTLSLQYRGDQQVSLGEFIERGIGVCRHQGLLAAYFMERMTEDGRLGGIRIRMSRSSIPEFGGTHAWAELVAHDGREYVVDPAQNFVGRKEDARRKPGAWDYNMPLR